MNIGNTQSESLKAIEEDCDLSDVDSSGEPDNAPGPGCLKMMAQCLGSSETKLLAGTCFIGGLIAMGFLGPALIPVLVVTVSLATFGTATATSLVLNEQAQTKSEILSDSVKAFFGCPLMLLKLLLWPISYCLSSPCDRLAENCFSILEVHTKAEESKRLKNLGTSVPALGVPA